MGDGPVGEAWVLSDREDHPSCVADGMADNRIGVARLDVLDFAPAGGAADPPEASV
jgi:hypothetical protein